MLSGGERRRVELSRILFAGSDVLCLDEPTNHLDVDAKEWLLGFLRTYRGALLVISHDLDLLDEAITRVLHLDRPSEDAVGHLVEYKGTYTQYRHGPGRRRGAAGEARRSPGEGDRADAARRRPLRREGDEGGDGAQHGEAHRPARGRAGRRAAGRQGRCGCAFPTPPTPGRTVIEVDGLAKAYGGPPVFEDVSFDLGRGERLLVLGLNGAGKTSLLRILAGETDADRGDRRVRPQRRPSATTRRSTTTCASTRRCSTTSAARCRPSVQLTETQLRGLLGMFGLSGEKVFQEAGTLSGGEKTKLALAMLMVGRNNLLLLDEPTNNLDPASRQAVADALTAWKGAIVFVSHDTEFVEQLAPTKVLLMPDGEVDYFGADWLDLVALA